MNKKLKVEAVEDWLYDYFYMLMEEDDYTLEEVLEAYDIDKVEALVRLYFLGLIDLEVPSDVTSDE